MQTKSMTALQLGQMIKKKEVSVYGIAMKCAWAGTKVIPHSVILKAMTRKK